MAGKDKNHPEPDIEEILLRRIAGSAGPTGSVLDLTPEDIDADPGEPQTEGMPARRPRKRRSHGEVSAYEKVFMRPNVVPQRSVVYIGAETKEKLSEVVRRLGWSSISVTTFADNILSHHLETFREEINRLYRLKNTGKELL